MIELKNISKSFGENNVLKNVSLKFKKGETNLIIGQSGSGKTVLLKSIIGLHEVDEGQVIYDDRIFSDMTNKERKSVRRDIGMVFQLCFLWKFSQIEPKPKCKKELSFV